MRHTLRAVVTGSGTAVLLCAALLSGCATGRDEPTSTSIEVVLPSSEEQVRAALIQVLTEDGYPVRRRAEEERVIVTGYRDETGGPWNQLLVSRFGVDRSRIDATLTPENEQETRVAVHVTYEAKRYPWSSWQKATPPLQHNAATQVRRVKRLLGLL
ncbi:MAG TPA: hypothetical protein VJ692_03175 [Nitrospiraceae bacterium]|nr:hypothetical protein [Nitrospiraceae bacterium]